MLNVYKCSLKLVDIAITVDAVSQEHILLNPKGSQVQMNQLIGM